MNDTQTRIVDPVALEVIRNRLDGITAEMQLVMWRSSFSTIVKEGMDCSSALFSAVGETLAQANAHQVHMGTMLAGLRGVVADFPPAAMHDGDLYVMNDPYCGGTHLPDLMLFRPVFGDGKVLAFAGALIHHQDVGGMTPGSIPTNATDVFQEGLRLPPLKFHDAGQPNDTLQRILRLNSRMPDAFMGDLDAQIAACNTAERRLSELIATYGASGLGQAFDALLDRSEAMTRAALRKLPNGTWHAEDFIDNDGVDLDRPVRIAVAVTIEDGSIHVDFTGSSPQTRGPINATPGGALASVYWCVRALTGADIPTNGGCFRPVTAFMPEGSVVNPIAPAPVNARAITLKIMCGPITMALAMAAPGRIPAPSAHCSLIMAFGGRWPDGRPFISHDVVVGGSGASQARDGIDCIFTDVTNGMNIGVEITSMNAPIRVRRFGYRAGGGGAGEFHGGSGVVRELEFQTDGTSITYRGERHSNPARGMHGGGDGELTHAVLRRTDGSEHVIRSKEQLIANRGDKLIVLSPGGGGYGDPALRRPAQAGS